MRTHRLLGKAAFLAAALMIAPLTNASAFGLTGAGGRLGYVSPDGVDGTAAFGGHLEFQQSGSRWHLQPNVMFWSQDGVSNINPNFDVYYHFEPMGVVSPYLGAGLGVHILEFDGGGDRSDVGANLFGGVTFPMASSNLFLEGRYAATDLSQFGINGGVTFLLPR